MVVIEVHHVLRRHLRHLLVRALAGEAGHLHGADPGGWRRTAAGLPREHVRRGSRPLFGPWVVEQLRAGVYDQPAAAPGIERIEEQLILYTV